MEILALLIAAASVYIVWKNVLSTPIHRTWIYQKYLHMDLDQ